MASGGWVEPELVSIRRLLDRGRKVRRRTWSTRLFFVLRCDLHGLGAQPASRVEVAMRPVHAASFTGFNDELARVPRSEIADLLSRERMRRRTSRGLYVAHSPSEDPIFAQWLFRPHQAEMPENILAGPLGEDEVLIEGAYTFSRFRGLGAMGAGMHQLLVVARDEGYRWALTGVGAENVASLRGCHRVGFQLGYVRRSVSRLGLTRRSYRPPRPEETARWEQALT